MDDSSLESGVMNLAHFYYQLARSWAISMKLFYSRYNSCKNFIPNPNFAWALRRRGRKFRRSKSGLEAVIRFVVQIRIYF